MVQIFIPQLTLEVCCEKLMIEDSVEKEKNTSQFYFMNHNIISTSRLWDLPNFTLLSEKQCFSSDARDTISFK